MEYRQNFDINNFGFWEGAKDRIDQVMRSGDFIISKVASWIEESFSCDEEIPSDGDINNLVWFSLDDYFKQEKIVNFKCDDGQYIYQEYDQCKPSFFIENGNWPEYADYAEKGDLELADEDYYDEKAKQWGASEEGCKIWFKNHDEEYLYDTDDEE